MGNSQEKYSFSSQFQQIKLQQNKLLGTIKHVKNRQTSEEFIIKQYKCSNQYDNQLITQKIKRHRQLTKKKQFKNIVNVLDMKHYQKNQMCGMNFFIIAFLEVFQHDLNMVLHWKKRAKQVFTEQELYKICGDVCKGLLVLYDNNFKTYTLTKQSIVYNGTNYKVLNQELIEEAHPYQKIHSYIPVSKGIYFSPQQMHQLKKKNSDPYFSPKDDVFQLGMLLLQLAHMKELDQCYDYDEFSINFDIIQERLQTLNYSNQFKFLLEEMLLQNEEDRIGLVSLKQKILPKDNRSDRSSVFLERSYQKNNKMLRSYNRERSTTFQTTRTIAQNKAICKQNFTNNISMNFIQKDKKQSSFVQNKSENLMYKVTTNENSPINELCRQQNYSIAIKSQINIQLQPNFRKNVKTFYDHGNQPDELKYNNASKLFQKNKRTQNKLFQQIKQIQENIIQTSRSFPQKKNNLFPISFQHQQVEAPKLQTPPNRNNRNAGITYQSTPMRKIEALQLLQSDKSQNPSQYKIKKIVFETDQYYEGQVDCNNLLNGTGIIYYPDGTIKYSGGFLNNTFNGYGIFNNYCPTFTAGSINYINFMKNPTNLWIKYEGQFLNGQLHGFGTLYFSNGQKFYGVYKMGLADGSGTFYKKNGQIITGLWRKDNFVQ